MGKRSRSAQHKRQWLLLGALSGSGCELQPAGEKVDKRWCVFGPSRQVWRVLDAQYFGVAQRRKRVLLSQVLEGSVAKVLFEQTGMSGNTEIREAKKIIPKLQSALQDVAQVDKT